MWSGTLKVNKTLGVPLLSVPIEVFSASGSASAVVVGAGIGPPADQFVEKRTSLTVRLGLLPLSGKEPETVSGVDDPV